MNENKINITNRHIASFVAVLLPFLAYSIIKDENFELSSTDKKIVISYIKLWWFFWILLSVVIVTGVISYFSIGLIWKIIGFVYEIMLVVLIVFLIVVIFSIFSEKSINLFNIEFDNNTKSVSVNKIILFIPGYNFYLWYKDLNLKKDYWLKESIFWWFMIMIFWNSILWFILLLFLIVRLVLLSFGIDILSSRFKNKILNSFNVNPEEVFAYLVGGIGYLWYKFFKFKYISYLEIVNNLKRKYAMVYNFQELKKDSNKFICLLIQNFAVFLILIWLIWNFFSNFNYLFGLDFGISILIVWVFLSRYISMWYQGILIRIPILDEICQIVMYWIKKIVKPI